MGSKKLKAIVVHGRRKVEPSDKAKLVALSKLGTKNMEPTGIDLFGKYGTAGSYTSQHLEGGLPTNNWDSGVLPTLELAEQSGGERLYDELLAGAEEGKQDRKGRDTCYACIVRCKRVVDTEYNGIPLVPEYGGPEYESLSTFGSYCGVTDIHALTYANQLCNQYGVDTISCGATIAWAMECYEKGVITKEDTGGIALNFGNTEAMIQMLEMTLEREGFGDVLADGSAKAADRLGKGHDYLLTIKGQELPAHMPQVKRSFGTIYAVNPFGADHQSSEHDTMYEPEIYESSFKERFQEVGLEKPMGARVMNADKIDFALTTQYSFSAMDTTSVCQFVYGPGWQLYGMQSVADLMNIATGWELSVEDVQYIGRRRLNLMRAYNAREGLTRDNDTLPKKLFKKALKGGASDGVKIDRKEFENSLDMYYDQAGWHKKTGIPTRETLEGVALGWVADDLGL